MADDTRRTNKPSRPAAKKPALPSGAKKAGKPAAAKLPPGFSPRKRKKTKSELEDIKEASNGLAGEWTVTLASDEEDHFEEEGRQVLKFHGIYQQDDRDRRTKDERHYSFMVRSKLPGGSLSAQQYLAHDELSDRYADGTLRVTTRQGFQFHGVLKGDLRGHLQALNDRLVTTLGACGDVVRNTMCCPAPAADPVHHAIQHLAQDLSDHFTPRTQAYHAIWLDGEKVYDGKEHVDAEEPLYGETYLPRKFKIGVAAPGDNCIDAYTQDVGLLGVERDGELIGYNLLVGGGLGNTHKKPNTYPRLGDRLAFLKPGEVIEVVEAVVTIQRDHGNRKNRKNARMKYLIDDWGLDRFQAELEKRLGRALEPPAETPPLQLELHLGWHAQGDGRWYRGLSVENGRIKDEGTLRLKAGLRAVAERFAPGFRLTPNHDVLLTDVDPADRPAIDALLAQHGVPEPEAISRARRFSMACPALPTCGLALTESERIFPEIMTEIEDELDALGLSEETLTVRMTGCPNGCSRPYVADIGFVGRSLDKYTVYLGGRSDGTRLNTVFEDLVDRADLVESVRPLLAAFRDTRDGDESFGDFCHRLGTERLRTLAAEYGDAARPAAAA